MYLKALEIQGFKSFPDKTVLSFGEDMTAIVGPNGSGKSNISDAIRWVMGEQSSKALRGGKMEDVIFGGTAVRRQQGFAEVSLVLDNTDHIFPMEESEVMVTRRYYRSGESEYYINRRSVRLKDVNELFMDTGLGREGYSIIGQGRIDEILSVKSADRREVFEEAAGISRFRHRKEEAERKLERTQENLVRITDKIDELELQVEPLRAQSEKARKFLVLRDELRGLEISLWLEQLEKIRAGAIKTLSDYENAVRQKEEAQGAVEALYAAAEEHAAQMRDKDVEAEGVRFQMMQREADANGLENAVAVLRANIQNNLENRDRIRRELEQQEGRADSIGAQIAERKERLEALVGELDTLAAELSAKQGEAEEAVRSAGTLAGELEELRRQEREHILSSYSYLRYHSECCGLRQYACRSKGTFYLTGWVPAAAVPEIEKTLARFPNLSCVADTADDVRHAKPPTKLKTCFLGRVFQPFLEMYGLPAYNEKDPSLFMALTYCLFFGIMFGDLGQGLCLALIGLVLARWKGMWLGGIITCCGLSGALFGCVYGSVFGFEDILPGFKIMEETTFAGLGVVSNVLLLLVLSICLGVFMLLLVMVINILNGIRQKNYEKILFGPNGAAGIVFYAGLLTAAVSTLAFGVNLFTPAYVLPVLILPLVLMLLREPLSHLLAKNPHWREFSVGEVLGTGFFELFETLLSYLTNTLSFMRVGAYAITHVGLMLVVHMLAGLAGGVGGPAGILILVLGNAFVMGFEGLLVGIQVLRLEFYELFGRFYDDGGIPFVPKKIDYAARTNG